MRLLIKFPTRGRKQKFFNVLDRYIKMLSGKHQCHFLISCDIDDTIMNNEAVIKKLNTYKNLSHHFGINRSKVEAINADMDKAPDYDVLLLASDDMIPVARNYDDIIHNRMKKHFPNYDGVVFFNDGYRKDGLNTLVIMGKPYYNRFGYIYHPSYYSLWCDDEFTRVANRLKKQVYVNQTIIKHEHPINVGQKMDTLYNKNERFFNIDKRNFNKRQKAGFVP
jgi:hypothetical protein